MTRTKTAGRNPRIHGTTHYQYSTAAPNYWSSTPTVEMPLRKMPKKQLQQEKRRRRILFSFYCKIGLSVGTIALSSLIFLGNYIVIGAKQTELVSIAEELREVQSNISFTEAKIAKALNISVIEETAREKLEMSKPLPHQIEYIDFE